MTLQCEYLYETTTTVDDTRQSSANFHHDKIDQVQFKVSVKPEQLLDDGSHVWNCEFRDLHSGASTHSVELLQQVERHPVRPHPAFQQLDVAAST